MNTKCSGKYVRRFGWKRLTWQTTNRDFRNDLVIVTVQFYYFIYINLCGVRTIEHLGPSSQWHTVRIVLLRIYKVLNNNKKKLVTYEKPCVLKLALLFRLQTPPRFDVHV